MQNKLHFPAMRCNIVYSTKGSTGWEPDSPFQVWASPLPNLVSFGSLLKFCGPQFPQQQTGIMISTSQSYCKAQMR